MLNVDNIYTSRDRTETPGYQCRARSVHANASPKHFQHFFYAFAYFPIHFNHTLRSFFLNGRNRGILRLNIMLERS